MMSLNTAKWLMRLIELLMMIVKQPRFAAYVLGMYQPATNNIQVEMGH